MTTVLRSAALALILVGPMATTAHAQQGWDLFHGAPTFEDENGNKLKVRGRILWDVASIEEEKGGLTTSTDDNEFRAARLGFEGQYDNLKFKAEVDYAGSDMEAKDVFVTYVGLPVDITVGQQKVPNSMEEETSSRHIDFLERAQFTDAFGLDRRVGIAISQGGDNYSWRAGVFGNSINGMNDDEDSNTVFGLRGTYALINEADTVLHIGGSYRYTDKDNSGAPGRSSRWGAHLASEKVKPIIGDDAQLFGLEGVVIKGPFHAIAEYMTEDGNVGSADGYALSAGYSLTGEMRSYKAGSGTIDRVKPKNPISEGGFGAVRLNARYDVIDATDAGDEENVTLIAGIVWTPETHLNIKAEYVVADADTFDADGFQMRFQWDW